MTRRDSGSDWFSYQAEKTGPKPSYKRSMPVQHRAPAPEPESTGMTVEESTASDSMIMRIIGKIRG
jgi:hypothetical protein